MTLSGIDHILLDLDNTVYPASSPLQDEIGRRMTDYVARLLAVSEEDALRIRRRYLRRYGTTLAGLLAGNHRVDVDRYLKACHPERVESFLEKDPLLRESLEAVSPPLSILTNSPIEHAGRVLRCLGIEDLFENVFDIRFNRFQGKPSPAVFDRVLTHLSLEPSAVLFVDDFPVHLISYRGMGGLVLLVDEVGKHADCGLPSIRYIRELPDYLSRPALFPGCRAVRSE